MQRNHSLALIGCGDISRRMLRALPTDQWHIAGLRRSATSLAGARMHRGDARDPGAVSELMQHKPDHLVMAVTPDARDPESYRRAYYESALTLASVAGRLAPDCHLVLVSSTGVYGQNDGSWIDESSPTSPSRESAQWLLRAEAALAECANPTTLVRFSGIYGPGREALIGRVGRGEFTSSERQSWTNRIHADDCGRVLAHLIGHSNAESGYGVVLASDDCPASNFEVESWLARKMGLDQPTAPSAEPRLGKRCNNTRLKSLGFAFNYPDFRAGYSQVLETLQGR